MWGTEGFLELPWKPLTSSSSLLPGLTLLAGLPLFSFLNTRIDKCAFALKGLEIVILTSLFLGNREGGDSGEMELVVTMLSILTLDVKLQMLIINKIYIQS